MKKYEQRDNKGHFFHHCVPELFSFRSGEGGSMVIKNVVIHVQGSLFKR